jgi:hypothetical protein
MTTATSAQGHLQPESIAGEAADRILRHAAGRATLAPSIHNSQPWRFVLRPERIDVYADRSRQAPVVDPDGRQLAISCGAAVFGARIALATARLDVRTVVTPDPADPDRLASVIIVGSVSAATDAATADATATAVRLDAAAAARHSNRRHFGPEPVSEAVLDVLIQAAHVEGAWLQPVRDLADRVAVATLTQRAQAEQTSDPAYRAELAAWTASDPGRRDGIPTSAIPQATAAAQDDVPIRDFDTQGAGELPAATHSRLDQTMLVLGTAGDHREDWLVAGQALGRVLLELTSAGLKATILSQVTEVALTREQLRSELRLSGHVQLLLRVGTAESTPATPRRPVGDVVSRADDDSVSR